MLYSEMYSKPELIHRILEKVPYEGSFGIDNIKVICELAERIPEGAHILEFGSLLGRSACTWALAVNDSIVWTVDIEDRLEVITENIRKVGLSKQIIPICCDSTKFKWTKKFDVIFIDSSHEEEKLRTELKNWDSMADILICGHDYGHIDYPAVKKVVDEFYGNKVENHRGIWVVWK